jgi:Protein of unknown function (DUF3175)/TonB dependent receptor
MQPIADQLTMNAGLRFDQMYQFVAADQLSPRISFTYKPSEGTTWHAGYARYFTPPVLVEAAPADIALFRNTTGAPTQFLDDPVGRSNRRKSAPFRSAMSMLTFYINRAGKNLSPDRKKTLEAAKAELRRAFGRKEK